ncbi:hypothetical protein [Humisphaera borealis]|uniref:Uncharacterized protein n=1 Tax=Humisphaera borealis TaxID=2807512 RepID=A0A7M2WUM3_9BACT|nr:hypothetical protein [Humisphaera borealis]QOV88872.1 hypothetical protein IPV69_22000 [Humisphaera borealis]
MTDQRMLLLVLIVIYLSECFIWIGFGAVAFRTGWRRFRPVDPPTFPGNDRGGWAMLNPFPPFGEVFVCHQWPVVVTPEQVGPQTGQSINFRERPATESLELPWVAAGKLEGNGSKLSLGGEPMMRLPDEAAAEHFRKVLARLAKVSPDQRPEQISRAIRTAFDTAAIEKRLDEYWRLTSLLRTLSLLFFGLLFLLLPISIYLERFADTVYRVLPMLLLTWVAVMFFYFRAHRRLMPADRLVRWKGLVTMVFAPTAAIRASDAVSRHLLTGFDPVAVGAVLLDDKTFAEFATRILQDLRIPLPARKSDNRNGAADPAKSDELATAFRARLTDEVVVLMRKRRVDIDALLGPPTPADPALRSYCPRCRLEYLVETGTCRDCGERPLVQLG